MTAASGVSATDVRRLVERAVDEQPWLAGCLADAAVRAALERGVAQRFGPRPPAPEAVAQFVEGLHAGDLGVALACEAGLETAWNHLLVTYRPALYRAATAMTGSAEAGRELVDSLWAELYGVGRTKASLEPEGDRRSLFTYFHGRAALGSWLRAVLSQRHVDTVRSGRRLTPLDDESGEDGVAGVGPAEAPPGDPDQSRLAGWFREALLDALRGLEAADRLRLSLYYRQGIKLAQIGRMLGEHEATVSRRLTRARNRVRAAVERTMRQRHRLSTAEIDLCYQYALDAGAPLDGLWNP